MEIGAAIGCADSRFAGAGDKFGSIFKYSQMERIVLAAFCSKYRIVWDDIDFYNGVWYVLPAKKGKIDYFFAYEMCE